MQLFDQDADKLVVSDAYGCAMTLSFVVSSAPVKTEAPCTGNETDRRTTAHIHKGMANEDNACPTDPATLRAPLQIAFPTTQLWYWLVDIRVNNK